MPCLTRNQELVDEQALHTIVDQVFQDLDIDRDGKVSM